MMRSHLPPFAPSTARYVFILCNFLLSMPSNSLLCNCIYVYVLHFLVTSRDSGNRKGRQKDYQPTMWNEYFDEKQDVVVDNDRKFRVYFAKRDAENKKPLLVLLHGGGYSALTWAHFTVKLSN